MLSRGGVRFIKVRVTIGAILPVTHDADAGDFYCCCFVSRDGLCGLCKCYTKCVFFMFTGFFVILLCKDYLATNVSTFFNLIVLYLFSLVWCRPREGRLRENRRVWDQADPWISSWGFPLLMLLEHLRNQGLTVVGMVGRLIKFLINL